MRLYEATYILTPQMEEEQVNLAKEKYSEMVTKNGGEIVSVESWGKRKLGYELKGYNEGIYMIMRFNGTSETAGNLRRNMKIADDILRALLIRMN